MDGTTPVSLQDELAEAIKEELKGLYFEDNDGKRTEMHIFKQNLPVPEDDNQAQPFPYCIVRLNSGISPQDKRASSGESVRVLILIGARNSDRDYITHLDVLGVMQRIKSRFQKDNAVKHFVLDSDIEWALDDEDSWPYSFGGLDMTWKAITIGREDPLT